MNTDPHETTSEHNAPGFIDTRQALGALVSYVRDHGPLALTGPWNIQGPHTAALAGRLGEPNGGWDALFGVVADSPWLTVEDARVRALPGAPDVGELSAQELEELLVAQFRQRLTPPRVAAGLFLMMGLHPFWGLQAANARRGEPGLGAGLGRECPGVLDAVLEGVDLATGGILEAFGGEPVRAPEGLLLDAVANACGAGADHIDAQLAGLTRHLPIPVKMGPGKPWTSRRHLEVFTANDLLPGYLIPAGFVTAATAPAWRA